MGRTKNDKRLKNVKLKSKRRGDYNLKRNASSVKTVLALSDHGNTIRDIANIVKIPKSSGHDIIKNREKQPAGRVVVLTTEEEEAVVKYVLWQQERGIPLNRVQVRAIIRQIHLTATQSGKKRRAMNLSTGPSDNYMTHFFKRHPSLTERSAETVDRNRINMATRQNITGYFDLLKETLLKCKIAEQDEDKFIINKDHCIYLADETGWGASKKNVKVIGRKGAKHIFTKKTQDQSHKTLMLTVCGNGEMLKPLIILEQSFPMVSHGEGSIIPENVLLSKTNKGSMEQPLFVDWLKNCIFPHKSMVNPDEMSLLILDNHGSRFSTEAIDLCIENKLEIVTYPGHLTHILQGPDVVLNKPIKTAVDRLIYYAMILNTVEISRLQFISVIGNAVKEVCTPDLVKKAFEATGVIPFNPLRIDLSQFPSSSSATEISQNEPTNVLCSSCLKNNVDLHPLVSQGVIPKHLANIFTYTPPEKKSKTMCKTIQNARCITSEEVRKEVELVEMRKETRAKKKVEKNTEKVLTLEELQPEEEDDDHEARGCSDDMKKIFKEGDYVQIITKPFFNYFAIVINPDGYGDEVEIQYCTITTS